MSTGSWRLWMGRMEGRIYGLAYATREPHSFLFINFKAPIEKLCMLRFEKYLSITN